MDHLRPCDIVLLRRLLLALFSLSFKKNAEGLVCLLTRVQSLAKTREVSEKIMLFHATRFKKPY